MKTPPESPFNTPREMLVRATFVVCLASLAAGILLTLAGAIGRDLRLLALGIVTLALAGVTREWLGHERRFEAASSVLDTMIYGETRRESPEMAEFNQLLREWDELERKRGSPDFDPWAIQAVRHDIRVLVEKDPTLERFVHDDHRHAA
jgi:hypothetical protein